jgi:hypothetical protein
VIAPNGSPLPAPLPAEITRAVANRIWATVIFPEINGLAAQGIATAAATVDPGATGHAHFVAAPRRPDRTRHRTVAEMAFSNHSLALLLAVGTGGCAWRAA